jgi:transketolase
MKEILSAIEKAHSTKGIPTCIVAKTVKGKGVSFMEHNNAWHKRVPTPEEYDMAMSALKEDAL